MRKTDIKICNKPLSNISWISYIYCNDKYRKTNKKKDHPKLYQDDNSSYEKDRVIILHIKRMIIILYNKKDDNS